MVPISARSHTRSRAKLTQVDTVNPLALLHETIKFPHLSQTGFSPALALDDRLDLVPDGLDVLGSRRKMIKSVRDALKSRLDGDS